MSFKQLLYKDTACEGQIEVDEQVPVVHTIISTKCKILLPQMMLNQIERILEVVRYHVIVLGNWRLINLYFITIDHVRFIKPYYQVVDSCYTCYYGQNEANRVACLVHILFKGRLTFSSQTYSVCTVVCDEYKYYMLFSWILPIPTFLLLMVDSYMYMDTRVSL